LRYNYVKVRALKTNIDAALQRPARRAVSSR